MGLWIYGLRYVPHRGVAQNKKVKRTENNERGLSIRQPSILPCLPKKKSYLNLRKQYKAIPRFHNGRVTGNIYLEHD